MIDYKFRVQFNESLLIKEVLDLDWVHAHLYHLLLELVLETLKELRWLVFALVIKRLLHGQFLLNLSLLLLMCWHWYDVLLAEEVKHLSWYFFQGLLGKLNWIVSELSVGHELHDV